MPCRVDASGWASVCPVRRSRRAGTESKFDKPLARTREYTDIVRKALRRERLQYDGEFFTLPLPDGPGKTLTLTVHPVRDQIPMYLAAIGPKNLELTGELFDGWLAIFFAPSRPGELLSASKPAARRWARPSMVSTSSPPCRWFSAMISRPAPCPSARTLRSTSGNGKSEKNFYNRLASRMGCEEAAIDIQNKYLSKDQVGAMAAVPLDFIDKTSLIGP